VDFFDQAPQQSFAVALCGERESVFNMNALRRRSPPVVGRRRVTDAARTLT